MELFYGAYGGFLTMTHLSYLYIIPKNKAKVKVKVRGILLSIEAYYM